MSELNREDRRDVPVEERICADCGATVIMRGRRSDGSLRWGRPKGPGVYDMTCRSEVDDKEGVLVSADYHYVRGEVQRRFRRQ
jgi:hypothetical protein